MVLAHPDSHPEPSLPAHDVPLWIQTFVE